MGDIRITRGDMSSLGKRETKKTKRANGRGTIAYVPAKAKPYIAKVKAELYTNGNKVQVRFQYGIIRQTIRSDKAISYTRGGRKIRHIQIRSREDASSVMDTPGHNR